MSVKWRHVLIAVLLYVVAECLDDPQRCVMETEDVVMDAEAGS